MVTRTFQQNVAAYTGTVDTNIKESSANTTFNSATGINIDTDSPPGSGMDTQGLLVFNNIFGTGTSQIPLGATITSAQLELSTTNVGQGSTVYKMLKSWSGADTWNTLVSGIQANGTEAATTPEFTASSMTTLGARSFNVTSSLQAWSSGQANFGWAFLGGGSDGWEFSSAQGTAPPKLTVTYDLPSQSTTLALSGPVTKAEGNTGSTVFSFTVTRAGDVTGASTASYAVTGSSANPANATDFTGAILPSGTVNFAANETSKTITVNVAGDTTVEQNEAFTLTLSNPSAGTTITTGTSTGTITNDDTDPAPNLLDDSYIATTLTSGRVRNMEHTNASKTFFHDGDWYAVLPDANNWKVFRFDGPLPETGTKGGWTPVITGAELSGNNKSVDIAWDANAQKLYVLQYWASSSKPIISKLGYDAASHTFSKEAEAQLGGAGGKFPGGEWQNNADLAVGIDQSGNPLVANIGPGNGGSTGLFVAYGTKDLATWKAVKIDADTTSQGGDNGDSKVDIVQFNQGGVNKVGLAYSADGATTDSWKFAWHNTVSTPSEYGTSWNVETITNKVSIDDHISAVSDGTNVYIAMKDHNDGVWLEKGSPGNWQAPVKVVNGGTDVPAYHTSRPTLVLDDSNDQLYVMYQESIDPFGDIYAKRSDTDNLSFNPGSKGTRILQTYSSEDLIDPQAPVHPVTSAMDNQFFVVAKNQDVPEIWYNDIHLDDNAWV